MKVAHLDPSLTGSPTELMAKGGDYEADNDYEAAISAYIAVIKKQPLNEKAYTRLMILYRKQKNYVVEAKTIHDAIARFEDQGNDKTKQTGRARLAAEKIGKISLSLGKLTGLIDKKGKSLYDPEPVASWKKRLVLVNKRLKTSKRPKTKKK